MKNGEKKPYKTIKSINKQDEMRDRAEDFIYNGPVKAVDGTDSVSLNEIKQNIHELRVHQIELQMQNEEILEAERKPGNSNSRYFNLYNLAPMGYCTVSEKGIILEANLTMKKMLGTEEKTMIKRRFSTYILKEDNDIYYLFRKKSIETDNLQTCELRMVKNDKKIFWVSLQLKALRDEDGTDSFFVAISDFSKHKQMETDLRESRAIFSNAFEFSAIGMALVSPDGHWLKVNQNVCHLLEYSESELLNMTFQDITCLDDLAPDLEYARQLLNGDIFTCQIEKRYIQKSGNLIWTLLNVSLVRNEDAKPLFFICQIMDIYARKQTEEFTIFLAKTGGGDISFFSSLARFLALSFNMDFVFIDRLEDAGLNARTLAVWSDGHFGDNITYALKDTPCGETVDRKFCCFPSGVCELFPNDRMLVDLRVESYMGVTLYSHSGQLIGLIALIGRQKFNNRPQTESLLKLAAVRAASELERLNIEDELKESNERYHSSFQQSTAIKLLLDSETGNIIDANQAALDFYGYSNGQINTMNINQINTATPAEIKEKLESAANQQQVFFNFNHRLASGEIRDVEVYSGPVKVKDKTFLHSIIHDVTQRKLSEDIIQTEFSLQMHSETKDMNGLLQDGLDIAKVNTESRFGFLYLLEQDRENSSLRVLSTGTGNEFFKADGDDLPQEMKDAGAFSDCVRDRRPVIYDYFITEQQKGTLSGHPKIIRELAVPVFEKDRIAAVMIVGNKLTAYRDRDIIFLQEFSRFYWDLVKSKKHETAILKMQNQMSAVLSSTPNIVFSINTDGIIEFINKVPAGLSVSEAIGTDALSYVDPDNRALALSVIQSVFLTGKPGSYSIRANGDDGKIVFYESHLAPLLENGKVKSVIISTIDISERMVKQQMLEKTTEDLSASYNATLEGWTRALELRETVTAGHSERVVNLTVMTARLYGVREEEIDHIRRGALLHDIGKIGIPDSILLKPGPLTDEEWVSMRRHPVYSKQMLLSVKFLEPAMDIPYCHHEKWDGSGYPNGMKGEEIPLAARIFAIVDVYDAMAYDRPYRSALPKSIVLQHLKEQSGKHFDPAIVEVFLFLMNNLEL